MDTINLTLMCYLGNTSIMLSTCKPVTGQIVKLYTCDKSCILKPKQQ